VNRNDSASDHSTMLNQLSDVMKKLVKEVMPKLVQDAHQKSSDAVSERNRKLESTPREQRAP